MLFLSLRVWSATKTQPLLSTVIFFLQLWSAPCASFRTVGDSCWWGRGAIVLKTIETLRYFVQNHVGAWALSDQSNISRICRVRYEHYIKEGDSSSCSWRIIVQNNLSRVTHRTSNLPILPPADPIHFKDIYSETFDPGGLWLKPSF